VFRERVGFWLIGDQKICTANVCYQFERRTIPLNFAVHNVCLMANVGFPIRKLPFEPTNVKNHCGSLPAFQLRRQKSAKKSRLLKRLPRPVFRSKSGHWASIHHTLADKPGRTSPEMEPPPFEIGR